MIGYSAIGNYPYIVHTNLVSAIIDWSLHCYTFLYLSFDFIDILLGYGLIFDDHTNITNFVSYISFLYQNKIGTPFIGAMGIFDILYVIYFPKKFPKMRM